MLTKWIEPLNLIHLPLKLLLQLAMFHFILSFFILSLFKYDMEHGMEYIVYLLNTFAKYTGSANCSTSISNYMKRLYNLFH